MMACANYNKLQQECETYRRQLGKFHLMKSRGWRRDGKTLWSVRGKQKAILETQELMDWHSTNCEECNRSAKIPFALTGLGTEPRRDRPAPRP